MSLENDHNNGKNKKVLKKLITYKQESQIVW